MTDSPYLTEFVKQVIRDMNGVAGLNVDLGGGSSDDRLIVQATPLRQLRRTNSAVPQIESEGEFRLEVAQIIIDTARKFGLNAEPNNDYARINVGSANDPEIQVKFRKLMQEIQSDPFNQQLDNTFKKHGIDRSQLGRDGPP